MGALKDSNFFVGNNSGPLNLSAALILQVLDYFQIHLISQLKFSKVIPLRPKLYR